MKRKRREPNPAAPKAATPETKAAAPEVAASSGRTPLLILLALQALVLAWTAGKNVHHLNTDAIAYLRIAEYYAEGNSQLMISGYWGPLLSWLAAVFMKCGAGPLVAGRIVMALSGIVFLAGALALFRRTGLSSGMQLAAGIIVALAAVFWSVEQIAPDLLLAGLLCLVVSEAITDDWTQRRRTQLLAGVWWALAYFAKPVAFPLAFVITGALAVVHVVCRTADFRSLGRATAITLGVFAMVSAPWIAALSSKYGGFTFSTSGRINHAIVGPGRADNIGRYHPVVREFQTPDAGRVTLWEDPSKMEYPYWSPFDGPEEMQHQIHLVRRNALTVTGMFKDIDMLHLGLASLLVCLFLRPPWRETLARDRWRWALAPTLLLGGIYLPVYVQPMDERYFYAGLPLLLTTGLGAVGMFTARIHAQLPWARWLGVGLLLISFGLVPMFRTLMATSGMPNAAVDGALMLAERLESKGLKEPIAGSGFLATQRAGLYTAFFLGVPWHGDNPDAKAEDFLKSGARLAIVPRAQPDQPDSLAGAMARHPQFRNLDTTLFHSPQEAAEFPLQVFEILPK